MASELPLNMVQPINKCLIPLEPWNIIVFLEIKPLDLCLGLNKSNTKRCQSFFETDGPFQGGTSFVDHLYYLCLVTSVHCCLVVTCWDRADLLALVCDVYVVLLLSHVVFWVRCGT